MTTIYTYTDATGSPITIRVDGGPDLASFVSTRIEQDGRAWGPGDDPDLWQTVLAEVLSGRFRIHRDGVETAPALLVHPEEHLADVLQALRVGGFGVFPNPDGSHYIARPWRVEADRRRREHEERRARMSPAELAADDEARKRVHAEIRERSAS